MEREKFQMIAFVLLDPAMPEALTRDFLIMGISKIPLMRIYVLAAQSQLSDPGPCDCLAHDVD